MATLYWTDGKPYQVDDAHLDQAFKDGFRKPTQEELDTREAGQHPIQAAAEGLARGFTMGGSDVVSPSNQGNLKLREEANPWASTLGNLAGAIVSPVNKLKLGAVAGQALWGLSSSLDESYLSGDSPELAAEKAAANGLAGALLGKGGQALMKAAAPYTGRAVEALKKFASEADISESLGKLGNKVLKGKLLTPAQLRDLGPNAEGVLEYGREKGVINIGTTPESGFAAAQEEVKKLQPKYDEFLNGLEERMPAGQAGEAPRTNGTPTKVEGMPKQAAVAPAMQVLADLKEALKPYEREPLLRSKAQSVYASMHEMFSRQDVTWRDIWNQKQMLSDMVPTFGSSRNEMKVVQAAADALESSVVNTSEAVMGPGAAGLQKEYAQASQLRDMFKNAAAKEEIQGGRMAGHAVAAAAGGMLGGPGGAAMGLGANVARGVLKERGAFLAAGALEHISENKMLMTLADGFAKQTAQKLAIAPEVLGVFAPALQSAMAQGSAALLATHIQLANSANGSEYMQRLGLSPESPQEVQATNAKAAALGTIQNALRQYDHALDGHMDGFIKGKGEAPPKPEKFNFKDKVGHLQDIIANPDKAFEQIPSELSNFAPMSTGGAMGTAVKGAQFLLSKAPKDPFFGQPKALSRPWEPSKPELDRWGSYVQAVEHPETAIQSLSKGTLSMEQKEVLQQVYPNLYKDLQERLMVKINALKQPLDYKKRLALVSCFGSNILGISQQQMQFLQAAHKSSSQQSKPVGKPDGRMDTDTQKNLETQAQRMESR